MDIILTELNKSRDVTKEEDRETGKNILVYNPKLERVGTISQAVWAYSIALNG